MTILLYTIMFVLIVVLLGTFIPVMQFLLNKNKKTKTTYLYTFPEELVNYNLDNLSFEISNKPQTENISFDRMTLADRGWVRCPNGSVMNNQKLEEKKAIEYNIELP